VPQNSGSKKYYTFQKLQLDIALMKTCQINFPNYFNSKKLLLLNDFDFMKFEYLKFGWNLIVFLRFRQIAAMMY